MKKTSVGCRAIAALLLFFPGLVFALSAGVGKVEITPRLNVDSVYTLADDKVVVDKINDPLFARALLLKSSSESVAVLVLDLIFLDNATLEQIRLGAKKMGVSEAIVVTSHTHSGMIPGLTFPPALKDNSSIIARALEALSIAVMNLQKVELASASTEVDEVSNRRKVDASGKVTMLWQNSDRQPTSVNDRELGVVHIRRKRDKLALATLVNYAAHPVVTSRFDGITISADYPGSLARQLEKKIGGETFFLPGAQGDQDPYWASTAAADKPFEKMELLGEALADRVASLVEAMKDYTPAALSIQREPMTINKRPSKLIKDRTPHQISLTTVTLNGNTALAFFPGELFVELGLSLKARSPFENTYVVGFTDYYLDYIPTLKSLTEGGYGVDSSTDVAAGSGETMMLKALINLYQQSNKLRPLQSLY